MQMSKFKKILVITLMLALTLTAFAVVSLAADEPRAVNVGGHKTDTTFETFALGESTWTLAGSAGTNGGLFINEAYPGGNKYLEMIGSTGGTETTRYTTFISDDYGRRTTYTLGNYPIVAVDFDIMSPDGNWGLYQDYLFHEVAIPVIGLGVLAAGIVMCIASYGLGAVFG